jgi:hypothetical protein
MSSAAMPSGVVVVIVLAIAALVGQLTPVGERLLPAAINTMANSSGPWAIVVFACVYWSRLTGWRAAALASAAFVVMVGSFYLVFDALGGFYPHYYVAFWSLIAVAVGPLVGLSASWIRSPSPSLVQVAVAAPSAVLVGEGIFMLVWLPGVSVVYSVASIAVGAAVFVGLAMVLLRRPTRVVATLMLTVLASAAFVAIYGLLPLVLDKVVP